MIEILTKTIIEFLKILPILIIAILISQIIKVYLNKKKIKLKEDKKTITKATLLGIALPGPILGYLPALKELYKKNVPLSILVSFMTAQALIGPSRVLLELKYFGFKFFAYHFILIFIISMIMGFLFILLEKLIKKN